MVEERRVNVEFLKEFVEHLSTDLKAPKEFVGYLFENILSGEQSLSAAMGGIKATQMLGLFELPGGPTAFFVGMLVGMGLTLGSGSEEGLAYAKHFQEKFRAPNNKPTTDTLSDIFKNIKRDNGLN